MPGDAHTTRTSVHGVKGCQAQLWCEEDERGFCGSEGAEWTKWEGLVGGGWGLLCDTPSSKKIERMEERRDGDDDDDDDDMMKKRKPATRHPCSSQLPRNHNLKAQNSLFHRASLRTP